MGGSKPDRVRKQHCNGANREVDFVNALQKGWYTKLTILLARDRPKADGRGNLGSTAGICGERSFNDKRARA